VRLVGYLKGNLLRYTI